jgi:hypothetical protein
MFRRRVRITFMSHLFSFPWRGPRNSEGPVDPEGWWNPPGDRLVGGLDRRPADDVTVARPGRQRGVRDKDDPSERRNHVLHVRMQASV